MSQKFTIERANGYSYSADSLLTTPIVRQDGFLMQIRLGVSTITLGVACRLRRTNSQ